MSPNLEARTVDSASVLITEHNVSKDYRKFPELYADTPRKVRTAIESGKTDEIPPIVALQNPFSSLDKTVQAYQQYTQAVPRQGGQHYEHEEKVLRDILEQNALLCYNGNRRLEEFQRAGIPIRAFVITSQEEYDQMPAEERRIPESWKSKRPSQYEIDQNYVLSYLGLLDDVVYIHAEKKHWDTVLAELPKFRRGKKS
jgi:hypothetical protein